MSTQYGSYSFSLNATAVSPIAGYAVSIAGQDGQQARLAMDGFGNFPNIILRRAAGTNAAKTAVQANDTLGALSWFGYGATGYSSTSRASVIAFAYENWTDTAQGVGLGFNVTPTGGTTAVQALTISSQGGASFSSTLSATVITGTTSLNAPTHVATSGNAYQLRLTGNGADQNNSDIFQSGTTLSFRLVNDAYTVGNAWLSVTRSGAVPSAITVGGNLFTKDIVATRGDNTGVVYYGSTSTYLYYDLSYFRLVGAPLIAGGGIQYTPIGVLNPSTGAFTSLSATGNIVATGYVSTANGNGYRIQNTGQGTDQNNSDVVSSGSGLSFRLANDAYTAANTYMSVSRTGYTVTGINFGATIVVPSAIVGGGNNLIYDGGSNVLGIRSGTAAASKYFSFDASGSFNALNGAVTATYMSTTGAGYQVRATGQGTDANNSDVIISTNGTINYRMVNDAYSSASIWMYVTRSGQTPTGVNISTPVVINPALAAFGQGAAGAGGLAGNNLQISGNDGVTSRVLIDAFGATPALTMRRTDGTHASQTAVLAGDILGRMQAIGASGAGGSYASGEQAAIAFAAGQNFTTQATGTFISFYTVPSNTTATAEKARLDDNGLNVNDVLLGTIGSGTSLMGAWTVFTPTIVSQAGGSNVSLAAAVCAYKRFGRTVYLRYAVAISYTTAPTQIQLSMPFTSVNAIGLSGCNVSVGSVAAAWTNNAASVFIQGAPLLTGNNQVLTIGGVIEVTAA